MANILTNMKEYEKYGKFEIRGKTAENDTIGREKNMKEKSLYECLRKRYESLPILAHFLRTLRLINDQFSEFLRIFSGYYEYLQMHLQLLPMLANALRIKRLQNDCLPT